MNPGSRVRPEGDLAVLDGQRLDMGRLLRRHGEDVAVDVDGIGLSVGGMGGQCGGRQEQGAKQRGQHGFRHG